MKKALALILFLVVGMGVVRHATALDTTNGVGPSVGSRGGTIEGGAGLQLGLHAGAQAPVVWPMIVSVVGGVAQGDALVLIAGRKVSKTATVGDTRFFGIATETAANGAEVKVMRSGVFAAKIGTSTTVGDKLVTSANPGFLTPSSAVDGTLYTSVSGTPIAATAFVTYTYVSYAPTVLIFR